MKLQRICLHHSGVSNQKNKDQFKANNRYHKAKWNSKSSLGYYLGYTYEISSRGRVYKARMVGENTIACKGYNNGDTIHICIDGNFNIEKPTSQQIYALRDLLKELKTKFNNIDNVVYHSDLYQTQCPGNYMRDNRDFIQSLVGKEVLKPKITLLEELKELIKKYS